MARTNQGIFKDLINRHQSFQQQYNKLMEIYYASDTKEDYDFFSDIAFTTDELYQDLMTLSADLQGMLKSNKFEMEDMRRKYEDMLLDTNSMISGLTTEFRSIIRLIQSSGGFLTEAEKETLDKLTIR